MKELKHLHKLIEDLRVEGEYDVADEIEKKAQDYYIARAKSIKKDDEAAS
jgi:hypothetical protein